MLNVRAAALRARSLARHLHVRRAEGSDAIGEVRFDLMDGRQPSPSRQRFHHAAHGIQPPFRQRLKKNPACFCVEFGDLLT